MPETTESLRGGLTRKGGTNAQDSQVKTRPDPPEPLRQTTDPHLLRMTAYPPEGPYDRWEVTVEATGEVIIGGTMPVDQEAVREACAAYHARIEGKVGFV